MRKLLYMYSEMIDLIRQHRLYFLSPLLLLLVALAVLVFHFGPSIVVAFIYAGV